MKDAKEWLNEIGEAVSTDMFCGPAGITEKPGERTIKLIEQIQMDAVAKLEALIAEIKAWLDAASTCRCYVCKHHRDIKAHIEKVMEGK